MMAKKFGIIQAPDGFYIGSILKSGMLSADARKITEQEITFMFEDMMRRHKAETGQSVRTFFHQHQPAMIAKIDPTLLECGIITPQMKAAMAQRQQQMQQMQQQKTGQQKGLRLAVPK